MRRVTSWVPSFWTCATAVKWTYAHFSSKAIRLFFFHSADLPSAEVMARTAFNLSVSFLLVVLQRRQMYLRFQFCSIILRDLFYCEFYAGRTRRTRQRGHHVLRVERCVVGPTYGEKSQVFVVKDTVLYLSSLVLVEPVAPCAHEGV